MQKNIKRQYQRGNVISIKYVVLSLAATILIALGVLGYFMPDLLSVLGSEAKNNIKAHWIVFVVAGVGLGVINVLTGLIGRR